MSSTSVNLRPHSAHLKSRRWGTPHWTSPSLIALTVLFVNGCGTSTSPSVAPTMPSASVSQNVTYIPDPVWNWNLVITRAGATGPDSCFMQSCGGNALLRGSCLREWTKLPRERTEPRFEPKSDPT